MSVWQKLQFVRHDLLSRYALALNYSSTKFSIYPWWKEKRRALNLIKSIIICQYMRKSYNTSNGLIRALTLDFRRILLCEKERINKLLFSVQRTLIKRLKMPLKSIYLTKPNKCNCFNWKTLPIETFRECQNFDDDNSRWELYWLRCWLP